MFFLYEKQRAQRWPWPRASCTRVWRPLWLPVALRSKIVSHRARGRRKLSPVPPLRGIGSDGDEAPATQTNALTSARQSGPRAAAPRLRGERTLKARLRLSTPEREGCLHSLCFGLFGCNSA